MNATPTSFSSGISAMASLELDASFAAAPRGSERAAEAHRRTVDASVNLSELLCLTAWSSGNSRRLAGETAAISSSMEKMDDAIRSVATLGDSARGQAEDAYSLARQGGQRGGQAGSAMAGIATAFDALESRLQRLGSAIESIGGFAQTIGRISSQTKLLALNATIEAARAGEAGRGFAVVATEVKALSEESSQASDLIRGKLSELSGGLRDMLDAMANGSTLVRDGGASFRLVLEDLDAISTRVAGVTDVVGTMAAELGRQRETMQAMTATLSEVDRLAGQNQTDAEAAAALIRRTDGIISEVLESARHDGADASGAGRLRADHMIWKRRLAECLAGVAALDPASYERIADPFGGGFAAITEPAVRDTPIFARLAALTEPLRQNGLSVVREVAGGNTDAAVQSYIAMDEASAKAMADLDRLAMLDV